MDTEHIKTFLAVYQAGSFVQVAKQQHVAPSSVSRSVAKLEKYLKTRLFQRSTRQLTPTQAGKDYHRQVAPLIEELELIHNSLRDTAATSPSGRLRITASVSYGQIMIAPRLQDFRARYPNITLELKLSDNRLDLLNTQTDLAVRHGALADSSLVARKLSDVTYHLVASPAYLKKHGTPQSPEDLQHHELISFGYDDFRTQWIFEADGSIKTVPVHTAVNISNAVVIRSCVRTGAGMALLANWTIEEDLRSGRLTEVLPQWKARGAAAKSSIWLVYPSKQYVPAKTKAFIDFMLSDSFD